MARILAIFVTAAAFLAGVEAQCPANGEFCGHELINDFVCHTAQGLTFITPGAPGENDPHDCIFHTDAAGEPVAPGVFCCAPGRCFAGDGLATCR